MKFGFFNDWNLGVVRGDEIIDVSAALGQIHVHSPMELVQVIIENFEELKPQLEDFSNGKTGVPISTVRILPPVPRPEKIICMAKKGRFQTKAISATSGPFGPFPMRICRA
mgnify:CR=1 FL=1